MRSRKPIYDDLEAMTPLPKASGPKPSPFSDTIPTQARPPVAAEPEPEVVSPPYGPTPTDRLAEQIGRARLFLYRQATAAEDAVNAAMDRAFNLEKSFTETVASLAPPRESGEQLMPGLVYVLVAGMAGSIVTRNRNVLLRATLPLAFGVGAGWAAIPVTMTNVSALAWKYEQRFPVVAQAHLQAREKIRQSWQAAREQGDQARKYVDNQTVSARGTVEDWIKKGK